jgi:hypothetical protein
MIGTFRQTKPAKHWSPPTLLRAGGLGSKRNAM